VIGLLHRFTWQALTKKAEKFAASSRAAKEDIFSIMGSERRSVAGIENQIMAQIQMQEEA